MGQVHAETPELASSLAASAIAPGPSTATRADDALAEVLLSRAPGLDPSVLAMGLRAFEHAKALGAAKRDVLVVIDYSRSSTEKRLWVLDLERRDVVFHELVAHGKNTGDDLARTFSNADGSLATSLGLFVTGSTYHGKHGYSLKLHGLDRGLNDRAEARAIVIHGAGYVSEDFIRRQGRLGRSWGCPAVRPEITRSLIDAIKGGAAVFAYHPTKALTSSSYLATR